MLYSLKSNKDKKGKQDYIYLLEELSPKQRDLNSIRFWEQEGNPQNLEKFIQHTLLLTPTRKNSTTIAVTITE
jgi:hypothetical protein